MGGNLSGTVRQSARRGSVFARPSEGSQGTTPALRRLSKASWAAVAFVMHYSIGQGILQARWARGS
jgi:hypothetical protein